MLGSGAAGLRAAVELKRRGVDVVVATQNLYGGTSACSGSDKQTLHTASGSGRGDDFDALARGARAPAARWTRTPPMSRPSARCAALASLQFIGLPIPLDRFGAPLRYKTDHDEAGPRDQLRAAHLAPDGEGARRGGGAARRSRRQSLRSARSDPRRRRPAAPRGRPRSPSTPGDAVRRQSVRPRVFLCDALVLAAGGPGELYRDSVYPKHCFGALGPGAGGGNRGGQPHREPVRHRHAARRLSLEPVGHLRAVHCPTSIRATRRARAQFPRRLLPDDAGTRLQRVPQGLPMAVPCLAHARFRLQPRRSRDLSRDAGGAHGLHGFQPQSRARPRATRPSRSTASTPTCAPISKTTRRCWRLPIERLRG